MLDGKTLLITGGTGSFGNTVLRRLMSQPFREIRVFSRDEKKQEDMRIDLKNEKVQFFIGDVRDEASCRDALEGVDFVFHAAALKQVPSCEFFPMEALRTNAVGADNVMRASQSAGVECCVLLSTDKAAYPVNAMGISKAMMEKLMVARARTARHTKTRFCATRYGNVMASRGSVIPLFIKQIKAGSPMTVTDPAMTRFMMSLEDAVDLVLYAFAHSQTGEIFVRKAPAASLEVLVEALKKVFGVPGHPVEVMGTRHGEKLYETLLTREEMAVAEDRGDYYRVPSDARDLNYGAYVDQGIKAIGQREDYHSHNAEQLDVEGMARLLLTLPEVQEALKAPSPPTSG